MADDFQYDVFLSHSAKDKAVVCVVAERLRADGLRVWFDEWVLKAGDSIPAKIEEGLEHSTLGFRISEFGLAKPGMSANAFGSDWAQSRPSVSQLSTLNHQPACDPLNKERRFLPRLDQKSTDITIERCSVAMSRLPSPY